jgi:glycosyltransferase involved in cell wall biosynthesis
MNKSLTDGLIIDPSLLSSHGHHFGHVDQLRNELRNLGTNVCALASRNVEDEFARRADVVPAFERGLYYRRAFTWEEFQELADMFARDLEAVTKERRLRPDLLLLPTADQSMILGVAKYIEHVRPRMPPEVLIWVLLSPHFKKPADDPAAAAMLLEYKEAFAKLRRAIGDESRMHIYTDTEAMAEVYQPVCGVRIRAITVRKPLSRLRPPRHRGAGEPMNIVCAGNASKAKGYGLLPETIRQLNRQRRDLRFLIHGTTKYTDFPEAKDVLASLSSLGSNIVVRTDELSAEDYADWLCQADIILLPYDTYVYRTMGSAVFDEASGFGIPVVTTKGNDFSKVAIEQDRAVGIDSLDAEAVARAVCHAADRLDEITERAVIFAKGRDIDRGVQEVLTKAVRRADNRLTWLARIRRIFARFFLQQVRRRVA